MYNTVKSDEKKTIADNKQIEVNDNTTNTISNAKNEVVVKADERLTSPILIMENKDIKNTNEFIGSKDNLKPIINDNSPLLLVDDYDSLVHYTEYTYVSSSGCPYNFSSYYQSRFSVAAFYSPNSSRNHLTDNIADGVDEIAEYKNRETPAYSFSSGLSVRYDFNSKWSISTGFTYSTLDYSMLFSKIYVGYGTDHELHYQYPTSCGTIEMPNDYNQTLHYGDSINMNMKCSQVVRFISIPLVARYKLTHNRFNLYADAGLSVNFMIQEQAKVNFGGTETTINNNIDGLKKMNFGYLLGAGLQYNIDNNFGIFAEPVFRGSFTSITQNNDVNCYPYSFGINTGVVFHF